MHTQSSSQVWRSPLWRDASHVIPAILVVIAAALIGVILGQGQWLWFAALCVLVVVVVWPVQLGLGVFALLCPLDMVMLIGGRQGRSVTTLVGLLAAFALLSRVVLTRTWQRPPKVAYWLAGLVAWSALTWVWALQPSAALSQLPGALGLLLLYIAATCSQVSDQELTWVNRLTLVGGCAAAIYVCYSYYTNHFYGDFTRRASMMLNDDLEADPNFFASSLLLPISIAFGGFLAFRKGLAKWLMLGAVVVLGLTIFLTMSRGALVALVVMIVVFVLRMHMNWRTLVLVASLGSLVAFLPSDFFTRVESTVATHGAGRLDIWVVGWHALGRYGLLGAGLSNFRYAYSEFAGYAPTYKGASLGSHNTYLNVSVELGIVGLVLFWGVVLSEIRAVRGALAQATQTQRARVVTYEAAFWALLTAALFLDITWHKDLWLVLILLGIAIRKSGRSDAPLAAGSPRR